MKASKRYAQRTETHRTLRAIREKTPRRIKSKIEKLESGKKMRRFKAAVILAAILAATFAMAAEAAWDVWVPQGPSLEITLITTGNVAPHDPFPDSGVALTLFTNKSGLDVDGLLIEYTGTLDITRVVGIGADMSVISQEGGAIRLFGFCTPFGTLCIDWEIDGAKLIRAAWLIGDEEVHEIDLHSPIARFDLSGAPGEDDSIDICVIAKGSRDPDGEPIAQYIWDWSDGVVTNSYTSTRNFDKEGNYSVTLTVADAEGLSSTAVAKFRIEEWGVMAVAT